jgi:methylisocitrate lyase
MLEERRMNAFRRLLTDQEPLLAALVINPISARLAARAGFRALYLGGGAMGYLKCGTEANLSLTEMCQAGIEIRTACELPLILDGACGWGDPMHVRRTIQQSEAAGFAAIEIEDQVMPKRAHHHIGIEHLIPIELMVDKVKEAVAAKRDPDFVVIARTNACRQTGLDDALRRGEAMRKAGADMLFVLQKKPEEVRAIGEALGGPLMLMGIGGMTPASLGMSPRELAGLGYQLMVDATTPLLAVHRALRDAYAAMAKGEPDPLVGMDRHAEQEEIHRTIDLDTLLEIERRTVER